MQRVGIVRLGAFGDIVHTLPLAADLHAGGWAVEWICEDRWACLLEGSPAVTQVHTLPRAAWRRSRPPLARRLRDLRALVSRLHKRDLNVVIDAQGLAKSALLARAIGTTVIGHRPPRSREGSRFLHHRSCPCLAQHVIDQQRALGLPVLGRNHPGGGWRFPLPPWSREQIGIDAWLKQQRLDRFWALNVGAGWPSKCWPQAQLEAFSRLVCDRGHPLLVLWGGPDEEAVARAVIAAVPQARMAPATSIPELGCLLRRTAVLVSGDTGPLHLARALATPAVGLFGPVPAERNGVRGPAWANLQAPSQAWQRHDPSRTHMDRIDPEAVYRLAITCAAHQDAES